MPGPAAFRTCYSKMKVIRTGLLAVALSSAACVVDGGAGGGRCDPGFVRDGDLCVEATAALDVTWDPDPDCPEGATTAQVVSVDSLGDEFVDVYWCDDYGGVTGPLALDEYEVTVRLTDTDEVELFAQSDSEVASLGREGEIVTVDFVFAADAAFFVAGWTVGSGCASAGIATVELVDNGSGTVLASTSCDDGLVESPALPLGEYQLFLRAMAPNGTSQIAATLVVTGTLEFGNQRINLGDFEF